MGTRQPVTEITLGEEVVDFFLVKDKQIRQKKSGDTFLSLELSDNTGMISAKIWDDADNYNSVFEKGDIVKVQAAVSSYQGKNELHIKRLRQANADDGVASEDFYPVTPYDISEMFENLRGILDSIEDETVQRIIHAFFEDQDFTESFCRSVAARNLHHPYVGGLLEHTLSVVKICAFLADHYNSIDRDILLAGAFIHDIGKISELNSGPELDYSRQGSLKGHMILGLEILNRMLEKTGDAETETGLLLQHMILSHQGEHEWGAPVLPMTVEAILLHFADNMDAKKYIATSSISADKQDSDFTPKVFSLGRRLYKGDDDHE